MRTPGEIVRARVIRTEEFGIYLRFGEDEILVLIPELSWTQRISSAKDFATVGSEFAVRISHYADSHRIWCGSIRDAHPEDDPWNHSPWLKENGLHTGNVYMVIHATEPKSRPFGYAVELCPGIESVLGDTGDHPIYRVGDCLRLVLSNIDPNRRKLDVRLADV